MSNDANKQVTKRKKKRFTDEQQVLKAIDKCHAHAAKLKQEAVCWEKLAAQSKALGAPNQVYVLEGEKRRQRAQFYEETKAKKLGEKLSQLRTPLLFGDDNSVPG